MYRKFFKRILDILFSVIAIVVTLVPMLFIAIAVKLDSKGPALFIAPRMGKGEKPFKFYKFRTMRTDAPKDCATILLDDNYLTRIGAFLRRTNLDEWPQLFCILKGDMSFVGPRPVVLSETGLIEARSKLGAYSVKPGLTGWAQINGKYGLEKDYLLKAKFDAEYVNKISFLFDLRCLFGTIAYVFSNKDDTALKKNDKEKKKK